jgi:hypothetical protein
MSRTVTVIVEIAELLATTPLAGDALAVVSVCADVVRIGRRT